jgi:hypothetical protein
MHRVVEQDNDVNRPVRDDVQVCLTCYATAVWQMDIRLSSADWQGCGLKTFRQVSFHD